MRIRRIRWARLCVAATFTSLLLTPAWASDTHKVLPGENINSLARKYHVSVGDIAEANGITKDTVLDIGRVLHIPDPPKPISVAATMQKPGKIKGDRISVRIGPGGDYRRVTLFDNGAPLVVTAEKEGWSQVTLPDGKAGWVRSDFLAFGKSSDAGSVQVASRAPKKDKSHKRKYAPVVATAEDRRRRSKNAREHKRIATHSARRHRQEQRPKRVARSERHRRHHQEQVARHYRHSTRVGRHKRYIPEASMPATSNDIVRTAYSYRGTPYRYGGASRGGFDCSGFTSYLYGRKGVALPHSASAQFRKGARVKRDSLKPGDLVFFETVHKGISHVGMYVGSGRFVHSSSRRSGGVRVDSLESGYYRERFRGARRFKK